MGEIVQNESVAETISQYMRGLSGLGDQDFRGRKQDCFFLRFSTVTKESLWKQFVEGISDSKIIESTSQMYSQYEYLNHLLGAVSAFITGKLTLGSIAADYKVAVNAQPWDLQLANALVRVREQSREVASAFKDLLKA